MLHSGAALAAALNPFADEEAKLGLGAIPSAV